MKTSKKFLKICFVLISFILTFIIIQIPTLAEDFWPSESSTKLSFINHILIMVLGTLFSFIIVYLLYRKINGASLTKHLNAKDIWLAIFCAVLSQLLQLFVTWLAKTGAGDSDLTAVYHTSLMPILLFTVICISPILEEFLWQGVLQGGLLKKFPTWLTIVLTGILFALAHGYSLSWDTLELLFSGLAYAFVYSKTKDLKMSILCHSLSNIIVFILRII